MTRPARAVLGRRLVGAVLVLTAVYALSADVSATHLFNPDWPAHARFHLAQMLAMLCVDLALGLWLLARPGRDPLRAVTAAAVLAIAFWAPILWITWVVPGTDLRAGPTIPVPRVGGVDIYLNVVAAGVAIVLVAAGWWLVRRGEAAPAGPA